MQVDAVCRYGHCYNRHGVCAVASNRCCRAVALAHLSLCHHCLVPLAAVTGFLLCLLLDACCAFGQTHATVSVLVQSLPLRAGPQALSSLAHTLAGLHITTPLCERSAAQTRDASVVVVVVLQQVSQRDVCGSCTSSSTTCIVLLMGSLGSLGHVTLQQE